MVNKSALRIGVPIVIVGMLLLTLVYVRNRAGETYHQYIVASASVTRLKVEVGELPPAEKDSLIAKVTSGRLGGREMSKEEFRKFLSDDWYAKYQKYGTAQPEDHVKAKCMHVYGKCNLKDDAEAAYENLQFYFP